ncbi:hypothetical protein [Prescottella equi]|uniref:hypothetical protein n=1 Tax=Rhodococcus hoagii TaxID=43767 RepID=UPI000A10E004|nr:hypothetical protein [Prescottella equi]ORL12636.1 hypothetical protein A6I85_13795 [Prescottella equi]
MEEFVGAIARLRSAGWSFEPGPGHVRVPATLESAPAGQTAWASSFSRLSGPDDTTWFLSLGDYAEPSDDAFAWNEFETMSREAASGPEDEAAITEFWRRHRPILLSVRGPYSYLAIRDDGVIVHGAEPEFEDATEVAPDLATLLRIIADPPTPGIGLVETLLFGRE